MSEKGTDNIRSAADEDSRMSFWDHLEVLRWALIRIAAVLVILVVASFLAMPHIFDTLILGPASSDFFVYKWFAENLAGLCVNVSEQNCNSATLTVPKTDKVKHIEYFYRFPCGEMNIEWEDRGYFWDLKMTVPQGCKVQLKGVAANETLYGGKYRRKMTKQQKQAGDYEEI